MPSKNITDSMQKVNVLVTGGTGSLGSILVRKLLFHKNVKRVVVFSRDEFKQSEMIRSGLYRGAEFYLGDVRDRTRVAECCRDIDVIIHCAALKRMDADKHNHEELFKTNVTGSKNICDVGMYKRIIFTSTDKAFQPTCLYGSTKALAEEIFASHENCLIIRFGNLAFSRGSVIPIFEEQKHEGILTVTNPEATRFWVDMEDAAEEIISHLTEDTGTLNFQDGECPGFKIGDLADVIAPTGLRNIVGLRPGEKMHESFASGYSSNTNLMTPGELKQIYEKTSRTKGLSSGKC